MTVVTKFPTANEIAAGDGWAAPNNAHVDDVSYASETVLNDATRWYNFGFDIPAGATIVSVLLKAMIADDGAGAMSLGLRAVVGGADQADHTVTSTGTGADVERTVDVTADRAWTPSDLADGTFKVKGTHKGPDGNNIYIDYIKVEVTYSGVVVQFPTANELGGAIGWLNPNNAHADDAATANGGQGSTSETRWLTFDFDSVIPDGATIDAVKVIIEHDDGIAGDTGQTDSQPYVGGVPQTLRAFTVRTALTVDTNDHTADRAWTRSDLLNANFKVYLKAITGTTADVLVDYVKVEVTYSGAVVLFPTANNVGDEIQWSNPSNMHADDGTLSISVISSLVDNDYATFWFDAVIPVGATIVSVKIIAEHDDREVGANSGTLSSTPSISGVLQTSRSFTQRSVMTVDTNDHTADRSWSRADLLNGVFEVRITGNSGASSTMSVDYVQVEVTYTEGGAPVPIVYRPFNPGPM